MWGDPVLVRESGGYRSSARLDALNRGVEPELDAELGGMFRQSLGELVAVAAPVRGDVDAADELLRHPREARFQRDTLLSRQKLVGEAELSIRLELGEAGAQRGFIAVE